MQTKTKRMPASDETSKKVSTALIKLLKDKNIRPEQVACDIHVSYTAVKSWIAGRRAPMHPVISHIEEFYGIKIL